MIKTTLPVVEKQIDAEGKLAVNKKNINVAIDTSLFAEERWELDLCQYFGQKKLKYYADFFSSSSSLCCGVI